jgi:hypothetical protein
MVGPVAIMKAMQNMQIDILEGNRMERLIVTQSSRYSKQLVSRVLSRISRWKEPEFWSILHFQIDCILDVNWVALYKG